MQITYPADKFDSWLQANLRDWVRWDNPLRLVALGNSQTQADSETWPAEANGGIPPTLEEVLAVGGVTDVEILQQGVQGRLDGDEERRTGVRPNPTGAVPLSRSWAATAMLYAGWHYPSEADLAKGHNTAILAKIYADPASKTTEESSVVQKQRALHFTLVMLEGQAFGLDYQAELGAYERTASGAFLAKLALDKRDWLDLPVHTWPSVRAMFASLMG